MGKNRAILIYLEDCILMSKKNYKDWQEIQLEFWEGYKANLSPMTSEEMIDFFRMSMVRNLAGRFLKMTFSIFLTVNVK